MPLCLFYCYHLDHHLRSFCCPPCLPFGGAFAFLLPFAEKSLFSNLHVIPPPQTFFFCQVSPQTLCLRSGTLPLNVFLFSPSSWLIPSLTHHDTNSFYLFSLWLVSTASHLIKTGHTQGRGLDCQVPCYTPRDRQVFV